jgi:hypothetical protein
MTRAGCRKEAAAAAVVLALLGPLLAAGPAIATCADPSTTRGVCAVSLPSQGQTPSAPFPPPGIGRAEGGGGALLPEPVPGIASVPPRAADGGASVGPVPRPVPSLPAGRDG